MTKQTKKKNPNHGGKRPGAGRKPELEGGEYSPTYLDDPTRRVMSELGEGNLSEGIRRAGRIIDRIGLTGCLFLLKNKEFGIDLPEEAKP